MFTWESGKLKHQLKDGTEKLVSLDDVPAYLAALPMSEKQSPVPPYPVEEAARVAADSDVKAEAEKNPDALRAAITSALAKAEACLEGARTSFTKCDELAGATADYSNGAYRAVVDCKAAVQELRDLAASLAIEPENPAPIAEPIAEPIAAQGFTVKPGEACNLLDACLSPVSCKAAGVCLMQKPPIK